MHPGGTIELLQWMLKKKIKWFGIDCGSGDHAMNTSIRLMRPDLAKRFEKKVGKSCEEFFGEFSYVHKKSGRHVTENMFPFHSYAFSEGLTHAENVGGDIERVLNQRFLVGAFPWRYEGLEACPCRILCFSDCGDRVEAIGDVAKAILPRRA
jgi:kynurenine formamidase